MIEAAAPTPPAPILPEGYTQIEYVERPSGTADNAGYNSTQFSPNGTDTLTAYIEFMALETPAASGGGYALGVRQNNTSNSVGFGIYINQACTVVGTFAGSSATVQPENGESVLNHKYAVTAVRTTDSLSIEVGSLSDTISLTPRNMNGGAHLFGIKSYTSGSGLTAPLIGRIYRLIMTEGNTVKVNMYPAIRNSDNAVGFYDLAAEAFRTSQAYVAGPTV